MLFKELRKHQWKAFTRNPMFQRNLVVTIFMFIFFAFLCIELLAVGLLLDRILLKAVPGSYPIHVFNLAILYFFIFDFFIKYVMKRPQSMQIAPYLCLPVKKKKLFNFLLVKEFSNIWNLYPLFLVLPFALISIPGNFGYPAAVLYIIFFYLMCIINSFLVNICNNLLKRNGWFVLLPYVFIAVMIGLRVFLNFPIEDITVKTGKLVLDNNLLVWLCLIIIFGLLWFVNQHMMQIGLYREMQNEKSVKTGNMVGFSFFEKFGEIGTYISLEIKMILRSKRIKQQLYALLVLLVYFFFIAYSQLPGLRSSFTLTFFGMFTVGGLGITMSQYIFVAESSFFDGLMSRPHNILNMLKSKYILYVAYAVIAALLMLIPVFHGRYSILYWGAIFFYTIGPIFFVMFQNAVYNKTYFDLFDGGMFNWKGSSGNMFFIAMLGMLVPVILVIIIGAVFSADISYWFMLITGIIFTVTANTWIKWIYSRFVKRKYQNMEGFRSNA